MPIDFFKVGKGVQPNEPEKSRFVKFFMLYAMRFWKLIALNGLFLLFCVPIVTIGPATVAMMYVLRRYTEERLAYVWADFWKTFQSSLRDGFLLWILSTAILGISGLSAYFYFIQALQSPVYFSLFAACVCAFLFVVCASLYATLLISTLDLSLFKILKNALILSVTSFGPNVLAVSLVLVIGLLVVVLLPASLLLLVLLAPVTQAFLFIYICYPQVVKKCSIPKG